jgi:hypothetical protein
MIYIYMWFCPKSGHLSLKYCIFFNGEDDDKSWDIHGAHVCFSDKPVYLSWNM